MGFQLPTSTGDRRISEPSTVCMTEIHQVFVEHRPEENFPFHHFSLGFCAVQCFCMISW